jgi:hypothetical protein
MFNLSIDPSSRRSSGCVAMKTYTRWLTCVMLLLAGLVSACAPLIGPYSPVAYQNATSLKAETLALMDKANEPYSAHTAEVDKLFVDVNKAYEFVKGAPSNSISAKQWEILIRKDGDLMGKFFGRWATNNNQPLSKTFINEFKPVVSDAFDEIICLEANKKEATQCSPKGAPS